MANNRIYLKCKGCGKELFLGKHFGVDSFYYNNYNSDKTLEEKLNNFYEEHAWCNGYPLECFEIYYEFDPYIKEDTQMYTANNNKAFEEDYKMAKIMKNSIYGSTKEDRSNGTH